MLHIFQIIYFVRSIKAVSSIVQLYKYATVSSYFCNMQICDLKKKQFEK